MTEHASYDAPAARLVGDDELDEISAPFDQLDLHYSVTDEEIASLDRQLEREALHESQNPSNLPSENLASEPDPVDQSEENPATYEGPEGREYADPRRAPPPGWHQKLLVEQLESAPPSPRREMMLEWARKQRARSIENSRVKYEAEGAYRARRKTIREQKKTATLEKEKARKRLEYRDARTALGMKTRRNKDCSAMTADERESHKKRKQNDRQKKSRQIRRVLTNALTANPGMQLSEMVELLELKGLEPPHPLRTWTKIAVSEILKRAKLVSGSC